MKPSVSFARFPLLPIYFKAEPSRFAAHYRQGRLKRSGPGITGFLFKATDALISVPLNNIECAFSLGCSTSDHQNVTVQGIANFRVSDPVIAATSIDFTVTREGVYASGDPDEIPDRLGALVAALVRRLTIGADLMALLANPQDIENSVRDGLAVHAALTAMGIAPQGVSITAITPAPAIAQALEARRREALQQEADAAIHARQVAAEQQDRALKQQQIETRRRVQEGEREVMEATMQTRKVEAARKRELQELDLGTQSARQAHKRDEEKLENEARIERDQRAIEAELDRQATRKAIAASEAESRKVVGAAEAEVVRGLMESLAAANPKVLQALAMREGGAKAAIATAFLELAERAGSIGNLNITPDLLSSLLSGDKAG